MASILGAASAAILIMGIWTAATAFYLGLSYRGLRFLANYQISTVMVTDCNRIYYKANRAYPIDYFKFKIHTDNLPYPIFRTEGAKTISFRDVSFRDVIRFRGFGDPEPTKDWCKMIGSTISVYHYDKLKVAIPYDSDRLGISAWSLFKHAYRMEAEGSLIWTSSLFPLLVVGAFAAGGIMYSIYILSTLDFSVKREEAEKAVWFIIRYISHLVKLFGISVVAVLLTIGIGLALMKGMLHVESSNSFLTGIVILVGLVLVSFGPALIFRGVHLLRTTRNVFVELIKDMFFLVSLIPLAFITYNTWRFVAYENLEQLPLEGLWDLLMEIVRAMFS